MLLWKFKFRVLIVSLSTLATAGCLAPPSLPHSSRLEIPNHQGIDNHCTLCHTQDRPETIQGKIHGENKECSLCHLSPTSDAQWHWLHTKPFFHPKDQTTCFQCHEPGRQKVSRGEPHAGSSDCVECHTVSQGTAQGTQKTQEPPHPWKVFREFEHARMYGARADLPLSCNSCHELRRPSLTRTKPARDGHFGNADCSSCHLTPSMTKKPWSYRHKSARFQAPSQCLPCHEQAAHQAHAKDHPEYLTENAASQCTKCHDRTTTDAFTYWKKAKFVWF